MKELSTTQRTISYIFQLISTIILAKASYGKFVGNEMSLTMFNALEMDGTRLIIATIEAVAALFLLTKNIPQYGAILGFGTMLGALIAHATVLGLVVNGDGGMMVMLMGVVIISTTIVMWIHRRKLPLIGHTLN